MTVAPHAPHEPYTPAPWYVNATVPGIRCFPAHKKYLIDNIIYIPYPRLPWFNFSAMDHVPWLAALPAMTPSDEAASIYAFYERFRALMAVDDVVYAVIQTLEQYGVLNDTCIPFFSLLQYRLTILQTYSLQATTVTI